MIIDLIKKNKTLQELLIGILLFGVAIEIIVLIVGSRLGGSRLHNSIGLLIGIIVALGCAMHLAYSVEIAVTLEEKAAINFTRAYSVVRYVVMCVVLAVVGYFKIGSPVTLIIGFLGLKAGAYLNPLIKKFGGEIKDE